MTKKNDCNCVSGLMMEEFDARLGSVTRHMVLLEVRFNAFKERLEKLKRKRK